MSPIDKALLEVRMALELARDRHLDLSITILVAEGIPGDVDAEEIPADWTREEKGT